MEHTGSTNISSATQRRNKRQKKEWRLVQAYHITKFVFHFFLIKFKFSLHFRFTDEEIDDMMQGAPVNSKGDFDYVKFTKILKHGTKDDE